VRPDMTIREVIELTRAHNISGVPVVLGTKVVGIVTHRDLRFETKLDAPVSSVMTPKERLVTVRENAPRTKCWRCCTSIASRKCSWSRTITNSRG